MTSEAPRTERSGTSSAAPTALTTPGLSQLKPSRYNLLFSETGTMPPFGNLYDLDVIVSESLTEDEEIAFNAGTHTELIRMSYADFGRLVKPKVLRLSYADTMA